jgi:hypothetical protein
MFSAVRNALPGVFGEGGYAGVGDAFVPGVTDVAWCGRCGSRRRGGSEGPEGRAGVSSAGAPPAGPPDVRGQAYGR